MRIDIQIQTVFVIFEFDVLPEFPIVKQPFRVFQIRIFLAVLRTGIAHLSGIHNTLIAVDQLTVLKASCPGVRHT